MKKNIFVPSVLRHARGLLVGGLLATTATLGLASTAVADEALWETLAEGGKVVMVRHTESAEAEPEVSLNLDPDGDCSNEQELSKAGMEQAKALGRALEEHGIAVEAVLSGELCRTRQTSERAFGSFETWDALNLIAAMPEGESEWLLEDVRERIGSFEGDGNLFLVTHRPNINTLTFQNVESGSLVVLQPEGFGSFEVRGVIPLEAYY